MGFGLVGLHVKDALVGQSFTLRIGYSPRRGSLPKVGKAPEAKHQNKKACVIQ